jgi:hypothetical protein
MLLSDPQARIRESSGRVNSLFGAVEGGVHNAQAGQSLLWEQLTFIQRLTYYFLFEGNQRQGMAELACLPDSWPKKEGKTWEA